MALRRGPGARRGAADPVRVARAARWPGRSRLLGSLAIALAVGSILIIAYGESADGRLRRHPAVLRRAASTASATCWRSRRR